MCSHVGICSYNISCIKLLLIGRPNHSPFFYVSLHNKMTGHTHTHTHTQIISTFSISLLICVNFLFFQLFPNVEKKNTLKLNPRVDQNIKLNTTQVIIPIQNHKNGM